MKEHRKIINGKLWDFRDRIEDAQRRMDDIKCLIVQLRNPLRAINYDGIPGGKDVSDTTLDAVAMIENYSKEITDLVMLKEHIMSEFEQYISGLSHRQRDILRLRYLDKMPLLKISIKTSYSVDHVKRLIGQSQDELR